MNKDVYLVECLKKRLLPFITKHHENEKIIFWLDLATCHNANIVKAYLDQQKSRFCAKLENPPNVPQARGIEKFWAEFKRIYQQRSESPKNLHGFKLVWTKISKEVAKSSGGAKMNHTNKNLQKIRRKGVRATMCDISNTPRPLGFRIN